MKMFSQREHKGITSQFDLQDAFFCPLITLIKRILNYMMFCLTLIRVGVNILLA